MENKINKMKNVPATDITDEQIEANKNRFINIFKENILRDGADKLLSYLEKSDFFYAPASTKYHSSCKGGLCAHSLNVYDALTAKLNEKQFMEVYHLNYSPETVAIVALLHDFCKIFFYDVSIRNAKDEYGIWQQVPFFTVDNTAPLGHGEKSVLGILNFIKLEKAEIYAIRWHMGLSEPVENHRDVQTTFEMYRLTLALFEADIESSYWLENVKERKN